MNSEVRILHVDDEPVICDLTKMTLERGGRLKVDVVHNAHEALQLLKSGSYSCIISDYEMPEMNGLDFLKEVRLLDKNIPFILFSGRGRESVVIDAINTGADFYIQKGGEPKALFAELNHKVQYAIDQRNTLLALKRRDSILEVVSLVSNLFLGGERFDRAIKEAITLFGLATEVDAVRFFSLEEEGKSGEQSHYFIHNVASWTRIAIHNPEKEESIQIGRIPVFPELLIPILKGEPFIPDKSDIIHLDPCKGENQAKSVAIFPVFVNQTVWGLIWFADYVSERHWTGVEIDALLTASSMIGSAIQQDLMKNSLITAKEEYAAMYSLMRRLCDTVPDILWAKDTDGKFIFVNKSGVSFLNARDTNEPVGKSEDDFPNRITKVNNIYTNAISDETSQIFINNNTEFSDLEMMTVPFRDSEGKEIGTVTLGRDITRYTHIENLLRKSKERYESIIQSVHIGIILVDQSGIVKTINSRALELINTTFEEIEGLPLAQNDIFRETGIFYAVKEGMISGKTTSFLISRTISRIEEDLHCNIQLIVPENGDPPDVLISLDPHYCG